MLETAREIIIDCWFAVGACWLAAGAVYLVRAVPFKSDARVPDRSRMRELLIITEFLILTYAAGLLFSERPHLAMLNSRYLPALPGITGLGVTLTAVGCGLTILARLYLGRNWSATAVIKQDHELVCSGPYRLVRHPIYTGCLIAAIGTAIAFGEIRDLLSLPLIVMGFWLKLRSEERMLVSNFGERYVAYRREVPGAIVPYIL